MYLQSEWKAPTARPLPPWTGGPTRGKEGGGMGGMEKILIKNINLAILLLFYRYVSNQ
jgi:hypothetical protein